MNKNIILGVFFLLTIVMLSLSTSAYLGKFYQGDCVSLLANPNSTHVNISAVTYPSPNSTTDFINLPMNKVGDIFNYPFCDTYKIGTYSYGYYDGDNAKGYSNTFDIIKHNNGILGLDLSGAVGWVIIGFLFLVSVGLLIYDQWYLGCLVWMINGFLFLFNYQNPIFGFLVIGIGVILIFLKGGTEK